MKENLIVIIRIKGQVGIKKQIVETLQRLNLRKKYSCVVLVDPQKEQIGMLKKVRDFVAYGNLNKENFEKLIKSRGKLISVKKEKIDTKKIVSELIAGKKYKDLGLKSFFNLHPPRGGIDSKLHFGVKKGVLGNNKEKINDLIVRML